MCAMDTRERALIRQSGLPEIILSAKYPVCVRTESGKFIDSNSVFLNSIKCQNCDSEIWFSGIDIDTQILFQTAEVDAFSSSNGVSIINDVILNDVSWDVVVESAGVNNLNLFVWRFFERYVVSSFLIKGKEFSCTSDKYRFNKIMPYLLGYSHEYSAQRMDVSVDQSKKIFMNFKKHYGFSDRDEWLRYAIISDVLFYLYKYFASNINSHHCKEM
ncbi:TPA: transcriptional regulator TraJ family protein [Escherichia coli]|uniref:transcriptional regulator TraJ family protein n=1 Tax=Escherichia coli TaxID=562 RepID=UPI000B7CC72C|nr:transcriptional regulator TraJ family protein [Escherichia coli]EER1706537.1 conjugal transfer protein TrbJ [Escherichia coli]EFA9234316.1 conjugal transfer protein TrbJ [Escherichia coli]EFB3676259.1 conjugal transfer protein TrbJ [Escherichia coli]EJK1851662.1 conjugal transfer protein TrbJ [Escherichia coli]EKS8777892.1 conjugal transfer protein TrbJ [Escherichia coli]